MKKGSSHHEAAEVASAVRAYRFLAQRAFTLIVFGALFCTLAVKLFHAIRRDRLSNYPSWVLADIAVLLAVELVLVVVCYIRPRRWIIRAANVVAAIVCTWSVMNAGWLIRTGTQILPTVLLPLFRDPLNALTIIGSNLAKMPIAAVALLAPSAVALLFFFSVLIKPAPPPYTRKALDHKMLVSSVTILLVVSARLFIVEKAPAQITTMELRPNAQLRAITTLLVHSSNHLKGPGQAKTDRFIPNCNQLDVPLADSRDTAEYNVLLIVLEGVQYKYISIADPNKNLTPFLAEFARSGVRFTNARSTLTHTTKVLLSILTGRYPSVSQDLAEAVPVRTPYASLATILEKLSFRTAFFQSAKGNFESRPGLVHNLGFDKFWARDDLNDPNMFVGSLGSDEFAMIRPVCNWITENDKPFCITLLCSVTHDPYEVPRWFEEPAKEPIERYEQTIRYTDAFLGKLDSELARLHLQDNTIVCIIGDHGEAFGEHGLFGHERIAFEEALRVPWFIRAPDLVEPNRQVDKPVSSIDVTPTLLKLLGFDTSKADFDGADALGTLPDDREVFFSGWLLESPAGLVKNSNKFVYDPVSETVVAYDLSRDRLELAATLLSEEDAQPIADKILRWRRDSVFHLDQQETGEMVVFGRWLCRWNQRVARKCTRLEPSSVEGTSR